MYSLPLPRGAPPPPPPPPDVEISIPEPLELHNVTVKFYREKVYEPATTRGAYRYDVHVEVIK
jgi:hypothetical protein